MFEIFLTICTYFLKLIYNNFMNFLVGCCKTIVFSNWKTFYFDDENKRYSRYQANNGKNSYTQIV